MGFRVYDSSPSYIYQTSFGYCFRFVFPSDLQGILHKKEVRYSLKTRDQSKAKSLSKRLAGFIQDFCSNIRTLAGSANSPIDLPCPSAHFNVLIKAYSRSIIDGDFKSSLHAEIMATQLFDPSFKSEKVDSDGPLSETKRITSLANPAENTTKADPSPLKSQLAYPLLSEIIALYTEQQIREGNWIRNHRYFKHHRLVQGQRKPGA